MTTIAPLGKYYAPNDNGGPLAGGKLYTYAAGTTTPKATFTTADGNVPNTNPVILDASGFANVWLGDGGYKFVLTDADDNTIFTTDDIGGTSDAAFGANVFAISTNTAINSTYANSVIIATSSPTLSLLPASGAGEGFYISVKNQGTGTVTIDPDAGETIDGAATKTIPAGQSALVITNGTTWYTLFGIGTATITPNAINNTEVSVASAATTNIGAAASNVILITGTTTITSLGSSAVVTNPIYDIRFSGALTLTHNATSLILPSGANIVTVNGDSMVGQYLGSGNWKVLRYSRLNDITTIATGGIVYGSAANTFNALAIGTTGQNLEVAGGLPVWKTKTFTSSAQATVASGTFSIAHGLGAIPKNISIRLICGTADAGYSIGDILYPPALVIDTGGTTRGLRLTGDATNITGLFCANAGNVWFYPNKTTGATTNFVNGSWTVVIEASV
jgi:hypothetical protein